MGGGEETAKRYEHAGQGTGVEGPEEIRPSAAGKTQRRSPRGLLQHRPGRDHSLQREARICTDSRDPGSSYATNTTSYLFLYTPTNQYYYLTAGRWFSANSLDGPWTFATPNLPADFAQIPPSSPAAAVLASVPGTEEAKDAVLLAQVPITVIVNPATAPQQTSK